MGNKKHKRGSIPGTTSSPTSSKTELIERTPENDYGVLSDPEEGTELNEKKNQHEQELQKHPPQSPILIDNSVPMSVQSSAENDTHSPQQNHSSPQSNTPLTQSPTQQSSPPSTLSLSPPLSQQAQTQPLPPSSLPSSLPSPSSPLLSSSTLTLSGRLTPSLPPPSPGTKSLKALQLKLTTDKNYSKKITLHTFFSYVVLAIEIERASSASIARISIDNVEKLVTYLIDNHTANKDIETYLNTLLTTDVIRNLIAAVLEFNTDQADALDKLLSTEQMEMEMMALKDAAATATATTTTATTATTIADDNQSPPNATTQSPSQMSQTSQSQSRTKRFLNFLKCLFCGCGGGGAGVPPPNGGNFVR
jgi:hypothetical protein